MTASVGWFAAALTFGAVGLLANEDPRSRAEGWVVGSLGVVAWAGYGLLLGAVPVVALNAVLFFLHLRGLARALDELDQVA